MDRKVKTGLIILIVIVSVSAFISAGCVDSDGGKKYSIKGSATFGDRYVEDYCSSKYVVAEAYCSKYESYEGISKEPFNCQYGCWDGMCVESNFVASEEKKTFWTKVKSFFGFDMPYCKKGETSSFAEFGNIHDNKVTGKEKHVFTDGGKYKLCCAESSNGNNKKCYTFNEGVYDRALVFDFSNEEEKYVKVQEEFLVNGRKIIYGFQNGELIRRIKENSTGTLVNI